MAAKIQEALGVQVQLVAGSGGVFDVIVENELIYSKAATGVFPEEDALVQQMLLKNAQ